MSLIPVGLVWDDNLCLVGVVRFFTNQSDNLSINGTDSFPTGSLTFGLVRSLDCLDHLVGLRCWVLLSSTLLLLLLLFLLLPLLSISISASHTKHTHTHSLSLALSLSFVPLTLSSLNTNCSSPYRCGLDGTNVGFFIVFVITSISNRHIFNSNRNGNPTANASFYVIMTDRWIHTRHQKKPRVDDAATWNVGTLSFRRRTLYRA